MGTTIELTPLERELKLELRVAGLTTWQQFKRRYLETLTLAAQIDELDSPPRQGTRLYGRIERPMEVSLEHHIIEGGLIEAILFDRKILPRNGFGLHYIIWYDNRINKLINKEPRNRINELIRTKGFEAETVKIYYNPSEDTPYKRKNDILGIELLPGSQIISITQYEEESLDFSIDSRIRALIQRVHKKPLINPPKLVADIIGLLTHKD